MSVNKRIRSVPGAHPVDVPPFILEREISHSATRTGLYGTVLGSAVLVFFRFVGPSSSENFPGLSLLLAVSMGTAGFYFSVRFGCYWCIRWKASLDAVIPGRIDPKARGELPRNGFLLVWVCPLVACIPVWAVIVRSGDVDPALLQLSVAVASGIASRDLMAAWYALFVDASRWIKETRRGLDVLKLVSDR